MASPSFWHRRPHTRLAAQIQAAGPTERRTITVRRKLAFRIPLCEGGAIRYLGGVEVNLILLLIGCQVLMRVICGRSHQHHPVAIVLIGGVKADHGPILHEHLQGAQPARARAKSQTAISCTSTYNKSGLQLLFCSVDLWEPQALHLHLFSKNLSRATRAWTSSCTKLTNTLTVLVTTTNIMMKELPHGLVQWCKVTKQ